MQVFSPDIGKNVKFCFALKIDLWLVAIIVKANQIRADQRMKRLAKPQRNSNLKVIFLVIFADNRPEEVIAYDIDHRPNWDLSCYGLNVSWEAGRNIVSGDSSQEELRLEAYAQHLMYGNIQAYLEALGRAKAERSIVFKRLADHPEEAVKIAKMPLFPPSVPHPVVLPTAQPPIVNQMPPTNQQKQPLNTADSKSQRTIFSFGNIPELPPI